MATMVEPVAPWLRELSRLFASEAGPTPFVPPADVIVTDESVTVIMDLPGLRAENLEIELENDTLTVRGERPYPYGEDGDGQQRVWRRIERSFGRFERSLRVPAGLRPDQVQASLADGVLTISVPRTQPPQPKRIQIESGGAQEQQPQMEQPQEQQPQEQQTQEQQTQEQQPETPA